MSQDPNATGPNQPNPQPGSLGPGIPDPTQDFNQIDAARRRLIRGMLENIGVDLPSYQPPYPQTESSNVDLSSIFPDEDLLQVAKKLRERNYPITLTDVLLMQVIRLLKRLTDDRSKS